MRALPAVALPVLIAAPAYADGYASGTYALTLDGTDAGVVHSSGDGAKKSIVVSTEEPTPALLAAVRVFLDGKANKRTVALSTPAIVQKATDARLVEVRLPSYAGASPDLALTFEVGSNTTSPSFRTVSDRRPPRGEKLAGARLSLGDLPTRGATRLDALSMTLKKGAIVPGALAFDVPANEAPPFLAWMKKPAGRDAALEYVSNLGAPLLAMKLDACVPSSVKIDGPVAHVGVACKRARID